MSTSSRCTGAIVDGSVPHSDPWGDEFRFTTIARLRGLGLSRERNGPFHEQDASATRASPLGIFDVNVRYSHFRIPLFLRRPTVRSARCASDLLLLSECQILTTLNISTGLPAVPQARGDRPPAVLVPYAERNIGEFAAQLFEGTMTVPTGRYREWMLEVLLAEVVADGALWRRGHQTGAYIHSVCTVGLPPAASQVIGRNREINPLMNAMYASMGRALRLSDASPGYPGLMLERFRTRVMRPLGAADVLGVVLTRGNSALETEITLYRGASRPLFTSEDAAYLERITPLLVASATHANFLASAHPAATHWNRPAALVNASGRFYDLQSSFAELLDRFFPDWGGQRLPFEIPDHDEHTSFMVRGLNVYAELRGDLSLVRLWERQPLEALSGREREVARAIASGLSYKSVARTLGLSPSTISNHLQRIYQKLAITNRSELADLVNREAGGGGLSYGDFDEDDDEDEVAGDY